MVNLESILTAHLVQSVGSDVTVVNAARVSVGSHSDDLGEKDIGLIRFLMKNRHASPFEHVTATFLVDAPIFVAREWHRHRTQSFNEVSGRYSQLQMQFYVPPISRPMAQEGKPGAYSFTLISDNDYTCLTDSINDSCHRASVEYEYLLKIGIAKEVARMVLPVNTYTQWYATANLRNWLNFLALRTDKQAMWEIRQLAWQVDEALHEVAPHTMAAWHDLGRNQL